MWATKLAVAINSCVAWVLTDRQQVGHLISPPLISLKSHRAPADNTAHSSYSWPSSTICSNKHATNLRNTKNPPTPPPRTWGPTVSHQNQHMSPAHNHQLLTCFHKSAGWDTAPGAGTRLVIHRDAWEGPRPEGVDVLLAVPPGEARLGTLLRRACTLPQTFILGGKPHHYCKLLLLATGGGGMMAAVYDPAQFNHWAA